MLMLIVQIKSDRLFVIKKILKLNYEKMDCDYKVYLELKENPLFIIYAFEYENYQYLIANLYIIRRSKTKINDYAQHTNDTWELFEWLNYYNVILKFEDIIDNMPSKKAIDFIPNLNRYGPKLEYDPRSRYLFYYNVVRDKIKKNLIGFDALIILNSTNLIIYEHIINAILVPIENYQEKLTVAIDVVLVNHKSILDERGEQLDFFRIIEFSNLHGFLREYPIFVYNFSSVQPIEDQSANYSTYHNLLNCFLPFCDGGRVKGLLTIDDILYLFVEDYYLKLLSFHDLIEEGKIEKK